MIEALEIEELIGERGQAGKVILQEARLLGAGGERVEPGLQDGDGRAQLVGGVGDEAFLLLVAVVEALQGVVDGGDQRNDLGRYIVAQRQAGSAAFGIDLPGSIRDAADAGRRRGARQSGLQRT